MTEQEVVRLTRALENGRKSYYVYALCLENGMPFYIGKGKNARIFAHEQDAADAAEVLGQMMEDPGLSMAEKQLAKRRLSDKIQTIINSRGRIKRLIIKWGLTEYEAYMCESSLINIIEWMSRERVTVNSLTNIANGHASNPEKESAANIKTMARTVETFLQECAVECRPIETLSPKRVVFININKMYDLCLDSEGRADREKVKETVRGIWRIGLKKARQVQYVMALYRQRVVGVFRVSRPPMSMEEARTNGFVDYPEFPTEVRRMDRMKSCARNLAEARELLSPQEYEEVIRDFSETHPEKTPEQCYRTFQKRIYFSVDDDVPADVRAFENCFPTKNGTTDFIRRGRMQFGGQVFNF